MRTQHPVLLILLLVASAAPLSAQIPPDARWRSFSTEHFHLTYQEELEPVARRAADRAEYAYRLLSSELTRPPAGRIDLVVANNVDFANGYATPFPTNRIVIYAHPPVDEPTLAFTDDWIELVVLHELVHIFHLDFAGGVWRPLRGLLGRNPLLFPEIYTPGWVIEGLATHLESSLTRAGRVRGTYFDMVLRTAILQDAFFSIDEATGDPATWPGGSTRYIYGSLFFDFLSRRFGPEGVSRFVQSAGRQLIPYRSNAVARRALGTSFSRAWRLWQDSLTAHYRTQADSLRTAGVTEPEVLTTAGRMAAHPRYSPDGARIAYVASTGRDEPSTRLILADGSERVVADRTTLGPASWSPDGSYLYFSQLEFLDPYRVFADLYSTTPGGDQARLSRGARFWEPDVHPDGRRVVGVADAAGSNLLEVRDLTTGEQRPLTEPTLGLAWSEPRWSPSGDRIAVSRWRAGGFYDVVLLDSTGAVSHEVTRDRAIDASPTWSPDGRFVLFSSDRTGIPDLYAFDTRDGRLLQITRVLTGAFQPSVSPDGRWIAFAYYQHDGLHIARIPFAPERWWPAPPIRPQVTPGGAPPNLEVTAGGAARAYSPWRSLAPSFWMPLADAGTGLGVGVGGAVAGRDVVERHAWGADLLVYGDGLRVDGGVGYQYRGLGNPVLNVSAAQNWSVFREEGTPAGQSGLVLPTALLSREQEARASVYWLRRRWQSTSWLEVGGVARDLDRIWDEPDRADTLRATQFPLDLGATLEAGFSSVRSYAFSIGPQQGLRLSGSMAGHRYVQPWQGEEESRGYLRFISRGRAYQDFALPGFAHHVAGIRMDVGVETGSISPGFGVGGASGGQAPIPVEFDFLGGGLSFPIRGYPSGVQEGNRAFSVSAEYRFPIWLVERGFGLVPLFLDRVWGDVFVDVGSAWCPVTCERRFRNAPVEPQPLASVGAELNVELVTGFLVGLPLRFGVATPLHEPGAGRPQVYVRIGRSF